MKKILFLSIGLWTNICNAQFTTTPIITTDAQGNNSVVANNLGDALTAVPTGGYIYLPGGLIKPQSNSTADGYKTETITVRKEVHIIGAGRNGSTAAVTGVTNCDFTINFSIAVSSGGAFSANKSSLEGIVIQSVTFSASGQGGFLCEDITIQRCELAIDLKNTKKITINDNLVQYINPAFADDIIFTNNIVNNISITGGGVNRIYFGLLGRNAIIENNIFKNAGGVRAGYVYDPIGVVLPVSGIIKNNIFLKGFIDVTSLDLNSLIYSHEGLTTNCTFKNNIFEGLSVIFRTTDISENNIFEAPIKEIFVKVPVNPKIRYNDKDYDVHLVPNSPYKTAGDNGTEIGIFGGIRPARNGAQPLNPHIYFKDISTKPDDQGNIKVLIKVRTTD
jgi:hypothetical protein